MPPPHVRPHQVGGLSSIICRLNISSASRHRSVAVCRIYTRSMIVIAIARSSLWSVCGTGGRDFRANVGLESVGRSVEFPYKKGVQLRGIGSGD